MSEASGPQLLLASASPQRRAILEQIGVRFEVRVSGVDELEAGPAAEVALENAYRKAAAVQSEVAAAAPGGAAPGGAAADLPVLGVDTVVTLGGSRLFGKPADPGQAGEMIAALAGRRHEVISGVCLIAPDGRPRTAAARTTVEFRPLSQAEVAWYVGLREWRDRAGGYAIQERGAALVRRIEGDYLNVVGLPLATLIDLMPELLAT